MTVMQARKRRISQEEIREALRLPDAFACNDERIGVTWGLGPTLTTRDSGVYLDHQGLRGVFQGGSPVPAAVPPGVP